MIFENNTFGDGPGREYYEVQALRYVCKGGERDVYTAEHACMGLLAETGEIAALYQKRDVGIPFQKEDAILEAGDVLWMLTELCSTLQVKLYRVINQSCLDRFQYEFSEDEETPQEAALHLCEAAAKVVRDILPQVEQGTIPAPDFETLHDLKMVAVRLARYGEAEGISMEKMAAENLRKMKRRFPKGRFDWEDYKTQER